MTWTQHVAGRIEATPIVRDPFPHIVVTDVFPETFYDKLRQQLSLDGMVPLSRVRPRKILWMTRPNAPRFWMSFGAAIGAITEVLKRKFDIRGSGYDVQLLHDKPGYELGPHTDSPTKALTGLFYLPADNQHAEYGTSLYRSSRRCDGSKDHAFGSEFQKMGTAPYARNIALFFMCHDHSWHAVERTSVERWVVSYDLFH